MRLDAGEFARSTAKCRGAPAHGTAGTAKKRKEHRTVNDGGLQNWRAGMLPTKRLERALGRV